MDLKDKIKRLEEEYLEPVPKGKKALYESTDFTNGDYYLIHNPEKVKEFIDEVIDLIISDYPELSEEFTRFKKEKAHISYYVRWATETSDRAVQNVFDKIYRINVEEGIEWGQPYYALNQKHDKKNKAKALNGIEYQVNSDKEKIEKVIGAGKKENSFKL